MHDLSDPPPPTAPPPTAPPRHRALAGTGAYTGMAIALLVLSGVFFGAALFGPSHLQWNGVAVPGRYQDGAVHYQYRGQNYVLDDPTALRFHEQTVYLDPSDPGSAMLDNPFNRVFDVVSVGVPLVLAALVFCLGLRRRRRRQTTEKVRATNLTGHAMDDELVTWLRERQRWGR